MKQWCYYILLFLHFSFISGMHSTENQQTLSDLSFEIEVEYVSPTSIKSSTDDVFLSKDSTQIFSLKDEVDFSLIALWNEAHNENNATSAKAYQIFYDFIDGKDSTSHCSSPIICKFKEYKLADSSGVLYQHKIDIMRSEMNREETAIFEKD